MVYCIRIKGASWRPKVFKPGRYTVTVGEGRSAKTFGGVESVPEGSRKRIRAAF